MITSLLHVLFVVLESPFTLFIPGFVLVRRLSLDPAEKVVCSVGASIFILYLYSFLVFVSGLPGIVHWLFTAGCLMAAWHGRKDLRLLFSLPDVRRLILSFAALLVWSMAALEMIRDYSGGDWGGDWYEHYNRALFFVRNLPLTTIFLNGYMLPARPPVFNLVCGHFMAEFGDGFALYQTAALVLNLTAFFPASLFFRKLAPQAATGPLALAIIMGLNPCIMQNATYTWSKLLTVSYVLLGIWFYCRFLARRDSLSLHLAFASLSAGFLTHYSAGPYIIVLGAHYLWSQSRRPRWREMAGVLVLNVAILSVWFGWSIAHYGSRVTLGSNASVAVEAQHSPVETLPTLAGNLRDTLVPPFFRANDPGRGLKFSLPALRDYSFMVYQSNLLLALGSGGWLIAILQMGMLVKSSADRTLLHFWAWFVPGAVLLGIGSVGERHQWGLAHLDLQPLILLGLIVIAAAPPTLSGPLRLLMYLGLGCDFTIGIALHLAYEHWLAPLLIIHTVGYFNWGFKQNHQLVFIGDFWPASLFAAEALLLCLILYRLYHERAGSTMAQKSA